MADCVTIGTDHPVRRTFRNTDGALETPTAYTVDHRDPSGNVTNIAQGSITVVSAGILETAIPTDETGVWRYQWNVTIDGNDLVVEDVFCVKASGVN